MAYHAPVSTSMLTAKSVAQVLIVQLGDVRQAARSERDDFQIGLGIRGLRPLACFQILPYKAPQKLGKGDPPGASILTQGFKLFGFEIDHRFLLHSAPLTERIALVITV